MRPTTLLLAAFVCLAGSPMPAAEGKRLAFVVGVDRYENLPPEAQLNVAVADAKRMKTTLESLDPPFTVRMVADGDVRGIEAAFDAFLDEAKGAECALVYFAGHGVEYHGANFLLVKDTAISDISADVERMKRRLATQAVSLQGWVDSLDSTRAQVKVVILDCCRDNPLKAEDGTGTRAVVGGSRGLAQVTPPSGTLISYSADAGQRANDGLFTEVLANNLKMPGLNILKVFAKTREEVREISTAWAEEDASRGLAPDFRRSRHEPAEYNKLNLAGTDFSFTRGVPVAVKAAEADPAMSEAEIERRAKEMAEKLVAEAMRKQPVPAPAAAAPVMPVETPKPMVKTDPVPAPAFPADRGMEGTRAGEVRTFGGIEMVWCPPGEFLMGSPEGESEWSFMETPHTVKLTKGFWIAKTECTQLQWKYALNSENPSRFLGDDLPVDSVKIEAANEWLSRMNKINSLTTGWSWSLPSEAQWEYACRAGSTDAFSGSANIENLGWHDKNSKSKTHPVAQMNANAWGLYDMHGNVTEWCRDKFRDYDPKGTALIDPCDVEGQFGENSFLVCRGGSWNRPADECRSAFRGEGQRGVTGGDFQGFRPAIVSIPATDE